MDLINSSFPSHLVTLLLLLTLALISHNSNAQFIQNNKGEIIAGTSIFNPKAIKRRRIKTAKITFFEKKQREGINQIPGKTNHYSFNKEGRVERFYYTNRLGSIYTDTITEWLFYKNEKLSCIKKGNGRNIKVKNIFYEEGKPAVYIIGKSINESKSLIELDASGYQEESAEYISHIVLKNNDTIIEWSFTDKTVFKRINKAKRDSNRLKTTISYPLQPKSFKIIDYEYTTNLLSKLIETHSDSPDYYYFFYYDSNERLVSFSKYSSKWQSEIEASELLYDEGTGNLQAILTKNKINNSINIKKYKYTYF